MITCCSVEDEFGCTFATVHHASTVNVQSFVAAEQLFDGILLVSTVHMQSSVENEFDSNSLACGQIGL